MTVLGASRLRLPCSYRGKPGWRRRIAKLPKPECNVPCRRSRRRSIRNSRTFGLTMHGVPQKTGKHGNGGAVKLCVLQRWALCGPNTAS